MDNLESSLLVGYEHFEDSRGSQLFLSEGHIKRLLNCLLS